VHHAILDLHSLNIIDRWDVLFFIFRLYWRKKVSRPYLAWLRRHRLPLPANLALLHAILAFIILAAIPFPLRADSLIAIYGSSLCLSILFIRIVLPGPAKKSNGGEAWQQKQ